MKINILILFFIIFFQNYGQENLCNEIKVGDTNFLSKNEIDKYKNYDYSNLWLETENNFVVGIIGENYQRILVKIIFAEKTNIANEYIIYGKSCVKSAVCSFVGKISITEINELKNPVYGVDEEFKNVGIKNQGRLIANYEFYENKSQTNSGRFTGMLQSNWYLDKNEKIKYDDIEINADGFFNNAFVGEWIMYNTNIRKKCNWGDYRVPNTKCDFDIGAGELGISEKYKKNGWIIEPKKDWWK